MMYDHEKSDPAIVCAGQRMSQEGSSPSGARCLASQRRKPLEDRVSGAIWNPKGLRRSIGP